MSHYRYPVDGSGADGRFRGGGMVDMSPFCGDDE